ncbi:hypothetical protein [Swaminathania salitolerans]|uniref:Uncharacterized protein n=1 Tax=Swaminathania salitolerans TaxID=182838 RepID=A0A511BMQ1_9PROT|nr:hypothetical protein [Swaminathania salitolerans]GBQ16127.1 hypothetical protein AA21291_2418 [Swaminathania salitolerans LMG 21291]GEL01607.1 hypothetical protein SSA02_07700 [Swaminathania salitolerans]
MKHPCLFLSLLALANGAASVALADPRAKCGKEPAAPSISTGDATHFNASVDRFKAYEKEARSYNSCVVTQAQKEEQAISEEAKERIGKVHAVTVAVQQRIATNFSHISSELSAAGKKLGHK